MSTCFCLNTLKLVRCAGAHMIIINHQSPVKYLTISKPGKPNLTCKHLITVYILLLYQWTLVEIKYTFTVQKYTKLYHSLIPKLTIVTHSIIWLHFILVTKAYKLIKICNLCQWFVAIHLLLLFRKTHKNTNSNNRCHINLKSV